MGIGENVGCQTIDLLVRSDPQHPDDAKRGKDYPSSYPCLDFCLTVVDR